MLLWLYNREISCGISLCVERENDFRCRPMSCCNIGLCSGCSCSSPVVGKRTDAMVADDDIYWVCDTLAVVQVLPGERFSGSIDQRVHCCITISLSVCLTDSSYTFHKGPVIRYKVN
jgi:hypothetical protein